MRANATTQGEPGMLHLIPAVALALCLPAGGTPARVPVVKTWKQLQSLPPIDLGGGVKVRLGLEADKAPRWSGVLLYCLTEGYRPPEADEGPVPLGPLHVRISVGDVHYAEGTMRWGNRVLDRQEGSHLYVRSLPVVRVGVYRVRVSDRKGRTLAEATLEGTADPFHPWMPWSFYGLGGPDGPDAGIALPAWDNIGPVGFVRPGKVKAGDLPTLLPASPKAGFRIALDGDELVLRSEEPFVVTHPHYRLLARWWVNGRPFVPEQLTEFPGKVARGPQSKKKELRVPLDFDKRRLGAKAGDKVGLQILYCPDWWDWCLVGMSGGHAGTDVPWMSNRIDFVSPGPGKGTSVRSPRGSP
jgi:hypothetical protein